MDDFVRKDKKFCPQILPHIVLSVGNVIYCKQLNDPASMKTKNRNTLMSTEHFSIHQGIFCTYRIKCKWQKINLCQSFFSDVQWFAEALRCFLLCYKNSFLPYFPDSHGKFPPVWFHWYSVQEFLRHCFWRSSFRSFRGCRNEDWQEDDLVVSEENGKHRIHSICRLHSRHGFSGQWSVGDKKSQEFHPYVRFVQNAKALRR